MQKSKPRKKESALERELRAALTRSVTALDDWLNTYAPEFCDEARVKEASKRLRERGTLAYIADVQEQNREALGIKLPTNGERIRATRKRL